MYKFETVHELLDKIKEEKKEGKTQIEVEFYNPIQAYLVAANLDNRGYDFQVGASIGTLIVNI